MLKTTPLIDWLMEGDPAIRWQTLRDLLDAPARVWKAEQALTAREGWGARLLALQEPGGGWGGGVYSPKWTSSTYTMLTLCAIGLPGDNPAGRRGAAQVIDRMLGEEAGPEFTAQTAGCDRCIVGMILHIAVHFGIADARVEALVDNLLDEVMPDGAWNCRKGREKRFPAVHSSFHTTFNVLDGLRTYLESRRTSARWRAVKAAEAGALEFMAVHRLYKSHRTGAVVDPRFTQLSFPPRWHYDLLRGLDYFARAGAPRDPRLGDAIDLLRSRQRRDGFWPVQHKHGGHVHFDMEKTGGPSRWNTLRALRVFRWWEAN